MPCCQHAVVQNADDVDAVICLTIVDGVAEDWVSAVAVANVVAIGAGFGVVCQ